MASLAARDAGGDRRAALTQTLKRWERRQRWQRTWLGLPRSLLPGMALGLFLLLWARLRFGTPVESLLPAVATLAAIGLLPLLGQVWLRRPSPLMLARKFERQFALGERLSTALELLDGRIHSSAELTPRQISDAGARAQGVDLARQLPLRSDRRAWALLLLVLLAIGSLTRLPAPAVVTDSREDAQAAAFDEAAAAVERISEEVGSDGALPEELREQLQRELERSSALLGQDALSAEEAFAALSESAEQFERQAMALEEDLRQQMQALDSAQRATGEELDAALQQLENAPLVPPDNDLATRLEQAAAALEESNPELAAAIRQALEDLRQFQLQNAAGGAGLARQMLAQQQRQMARTEGAQQRLRAASDQLRDSANQIARRSQAPPLESGQSMQRQQGGGEAPQAGDMSMQGQPQAGDLSQTGENPQAGGQPGGDQGAPGEEAQGNVQQGSQPGGEQGSQGPGASEQMAPGLGGQAGDVPGGAGMEESFAGIEGAPPGQMNNPDGQGQRDFAPVYAPRRIGSTQGPELFLETDPEETTLMEGDFAPNPSGEALVPWNEIYGDYRDAASRALESDYIPLGLRDVVHDYFSALEPGQ